MASLVYVNGALGLLNGSIAWTTDTIKGILVTGYTPSHSHQFLSDVSASEGAWAGITRPTLGSKTGPAIDATDNVKYDAADVDFGTLGASSSPSHLILYKDTGTPGTSTLIAAVENTDAGVKDPNGGNWTFAFDATGCFYLETTPV